MTAKIIPGILTKRITEAQKKLDQLSVFADEVHIDICDGRLVPNTTFGANDLKNLKIEIGYSLHLMIMLDAEQLFAFAQTKARSLIIYPKATQNLERDIFRIRGMRKIVGVALDIDEEPELIKDHLSLIDFVLILGVPSGFTGQDFHPEVLQKVSKLRSYKFDVSVGIDGGIKPGIVRLAAESGVDFVVSASYIWQAKNLVNAIAELDHEFSKGRQKSLNEKTIQI